MYSSRPRSKAIAAVRGAVAAVEGAAMLFIRSGLCARTRAKVERERCGLMFATSLWAVRELTRLVDCRIRMYQEQKDRNRSAL